MTNRFLNAQVGLQLRVLDRAAEAGGSASGRRGLARMTGLAAAGAALTAPTFAAAQKACANAANASTSGLVNLIQQAAFFLIILGGALFVLMLAVGGFLIMSGGANHKHVKRGMGVVKNALIGLGILVTGVFIRTVLVKFVGGATDGKNSNECLSKDPWGDPSK